MCIGDETFQVYSKDTYFCNVFPLLEGMNCEKLEIEYRSKNYLKMSLIFGKIFGFRDPFMMEKIPILSITRFLPLKFNSSDISAKISSLLSFSFDIGPKPK